MWIRLPVALTPKEDEVQKMPRIQMSALFCILFNSLRGYESGTLL